MVKKRLLETFAMAIIGDSLLCMVSPQRHISLWRSGPRWWQQAWEPFIRLPDLTRMLGLLGLGFGIWLAWKQEPKISDPRPLQGSLPRRWSRTLAKAAH